MSNELFVKCLQCADMCGVDIECGDLQENSATEGFTVKCPFCGCVFRCDVYADIMNKELLIP